VRTVADFLDPARFPPESTRHIGRLLRREGVSLARASADALIGGRPVYLDADTPVADARALMSEHAIEQLPVLGDDGLVGFVSRESLTGEPSAA
jgi:CBS domain-containing protein